MKNEADRPMDPALGNTDCRFFGRDRTFCVVLGVLGSIMMNVRFTKQKAQKSCLFPGGSSIYLSTGQDQSSTSDCAIQIGTGLPEYGHM